uniref:Protein transport protein Sec31A n=1 Tax=Myripristis murdjan TaxID=586833 RepID=A0A667XYL9_9TELE
MRLKEIQRTAHQAWSPAMHHPVYLALGTSAQQLDASFNTTAALEIFEMDFSDPSMDICNLQIHNWTVLKLIIWVNFGMGADGTGGRLVGGSENGTLTVYSPEAIITSGAEAVVGQSDKHTGPVRALDFNPFQSNLLASGANDSEIYIWDLNNFSNPMTPGAKTQPAEDISVVSWNRQVQHILASANPSGKAVVWDLRKNEPIIKISDHSNRMHCSGMLWHPDVATQLVLASEDDRLPVIQMWDLRFATSPLKVLENHTRGILSISWSQADSELLLSSAKDNRILCWNPNTAEVIYELPTTNQWCFDVQWCPRNPALLSAASFDGRISVYSVMGGSLEAQQQSTADKISSSFDTMDPFGTGQVLPPLQVPQPTAPATIVPPLKKPPKWVRRPVGASFAFGGKLITFENPKVPPVQSPQPIPRQVLVSQVTTETEFLQRSRELQAALQSGSFTNYCQAKIQNAPSDAEQDIWKFLLVNFEDEARVKFLRLLGFSKDELEKKVLFYSLYAHYFCCPKFSALIYKILFFNFQRSEEASAAADSKSSGSASPSDFFSHIRKENPNFQIPVSSDTDGLISQALLVGNFEGAVDLCLNDGRYAEAILLSISGGEELLKKTQQRYLDKQKNSISMLISSVVTQNWRDIVQSCELDNWKEALAALLTYAHPEEFARLCGKLLKSGEGTEKRCLQACLCYICSGNIEKLVECWALQRDCSSPLVLEDLVEKVMILRKSIERLRNSEVAVQSPILAEKLSRYAGILAAEGSLAAAMTYLPENSDQVRGIASVLTHETLCYSLTTESVPTFPSCPDGSGWAASYAVSFYPTCCSYQHWAWPAALLSCTATQCPPPCHTAFLPPTSCSCSRFDLVQLNIQPMPVGGPSAFPPPGPTMPAASLSGPPLPSSSSAPGGLPPMPSPGVPPTGFMPSTSLPSGPMAGSPQPGAPVPMYPGGSHNQGPAPPMGPGPYTPLGSGYPQGGPGAPAVKPFPTSAAPPPPPTGRSHISQFLLQCFETMFLSLSECCIVICTQVPDNYTPPAPITAPVMGFPVEAPQPHDHAQVAPGAPQEPNVQVGVWCFCTVFLQLLQQLPAERVEQREIPAEHMILKSTFDSLVQRCQLAAGDPQTKRKLDDAAKRLGYLYDKLRDQSLSHHILGGLHEISRCVASQNYQRGLEVHTQVVSSSNFSEISAFMPILKVVMTIANKLGV